VDQTHYTWLSLNNWSLLDEDGVEQQQQQQQLYFIWFPRSTIYL